MQSLYGEAMKVNSSGMHTNDELLRSFTINEIASLSCIIHLEMEDDCESIQDLMSILANSTLVDVQLSSRDDMVNHSEKARSWNETQVATTRTLLARDLDQASNTTASASHSPTVTADAWKNPSDITAIVIGSVAAASLAAVLIGSTVFACTKFFRGEPVFSMSGKKNSADADVEKAENVTVESRSKHTAILTQDAPWTKRPSPEQQPRENSGQILLSSLLLSNTAIVETELRAPYTDLRGEHAICATLRA
ncbi:uncharacterized protein BDR25DRAFT_362391 [Lindgomyces ingoldianus]|uniref:Uncharacterized protein n=1 Tax=Lindgomyces ingoldianus TaxID=673940 RepID=A0ACB6QCJ0_9PLEO|nr:uncharacterized protein BDR25DRAFT_362391 [Lindgomyces ingoldianus]KAF2463837.1 hypothetical protein BDR25DRAFT_362391 [Lindgomyces ingoldianus]